MALDDKAKQAKGKAKQAAGDLTGNDDLKAKGQADETKGKVHEDVDRVVDAIKDGLDWIADRLKGR